MEEFSRVEQMSELELIRWKFLLEHVRQIEERLIILEASVAPGLRLPDARLLAAQDALEVEIAKRTIAKGGK